MAKRKELTKKVRFEVFKRDSFKCMYCGDSAPETVLQVDHIKPVAKGGTNDILNLVTSCFGCNSGKRDRELNDEAVMVKRKAQLDQLQERREQLEMLMEWQHGLLSTEDDAVDNLVLILEERLYLAKDRHISPTGKNDVRRWLRTYGYQEVVEATSIASGAYLRFDDNGQATLESFGEAFRKTGGILKRRKMEQEDPDMAKIYHCFFVLKKNVPYGSVQSQGLKLLKAAFDQGVPTTELMRLAKSQHSGWRSFQEDLDALIERHSP